MSDDDRTDATQTLPEQASADGQITGQRLRAVFAAASAWLERNAEAINAINVFPVPDGDTGSNMAATLRDTIGQVGVGLQSAGDVTAALAKNALMAARGNSGVIFSQLLRGFADATAGLDRLDGPALARAFAEAARTAYGALERPVEGTILTVARAAADAAESIRSTDPRPVFEAALAGARAGLARTPDLLPVLRQAGVVDSGGFGLVVFLEGAVRYLRGEAPPDTAVDAGSIDANWLANAADHGGEGASGYGYCTEFIVLSPSLDGGDLRQRLASLGDSLVVAGDATATHIHLHTDDPGAAISFATSTGRLTRIKIENMQLQHEELLRSRATDALVAAGAADGPSPLIATVFVASGPGLADTARSLGATAVIAGGQTMNPSVEQILNAIERAPSQLVIVLPNNKNVILTARQAAKLVESRKEVRVVATRSVPQGFAALLTLNLETELDENATEMAAAAGAVRTIEVTRAARTTRFGNVDVADGQPIGLIDDELVVAADSFLDALVETLARLPPADGAIVTLYCGEGVTGEEAAAAEQRLGERFPRIELQRLEGGQPHYPFVASVE